MSTIANTTILSNFANVGVLDLLHRLYNTLHISVEVYAEIREGLDEGYTFYSAVEPLIHPVVSNGWILLTALNDAELPLFSQMPARLHKGEASSIAIAHHRQWLFLSDDLAARKYARAMDVRVTGTIGCLVVAIDRDLCTLDDANRWLATMIQQGYRSPVPDLTPLIESR